MSEMDRMMAQLMEFLKPKGDAESGVKKIMKNMNVVMLHFLENCVGCGECASSCPFYAVDYSLAPMNKAEELRKIYRKEMTIAGKILGSLVGAEKPKDKKDLIRLQQIVYACTNCGHCYVTCPFGIHSGRVIGTLKTLVDHVGLSPTLIKIFEAFEIGGAYKQHPKMVELWQNYLKTAEERVKQRLGDYQIPYDKKGAKYLLLIWFSDVMMMFNAAVAAIEIMSLLGKKANIDWTTNKEPVGVRTPISIVVGNTEGVLPAVKQVVEYIESIGPEYVIFIDGGFPTPFWRYDGRAAIVKALGGKQPKWKVIHITEFLDSLRERGVIKFKQANDPITWHDPCQMGRHAGIFEPPRNLLKAASKGYRDLPHNRKMNYCCGGGGGNECIVRETREWIEQMFGMKIPMDEVQLELERISTERMKITTRRKAMDIKKSGAKLVLTACPACISTINKGLKMHGVDAKAMHILEYLVDKIEV